MVKGCILLGAPGSGKGTQAKFLTKKFGIPHISTGDMLRSAVNEGSVLGHRVKEIMTTGKLVSDALIVAVVQDRFSKPDIQGGYILDGFPRTIPQAEAFENLIPKLKIPSPAVFYLNVPEDALVERLTGRASCNACGSVFHIIFNPPKNDMICDNCRGSLVQREDDKKDTVLKRLEVFKEETSPLLEYYSKKNELITIDGSQEVTQIADLLVEKLAA